MIATVRHPPRNAGKRRSCYKSSWVGLPGDQLAERRSGQSSLRPASTPFSVEPGQPDRRTETRGGRRCDPQTRRHGEQRSRSADASSGSATSGGAMIEELRRLRNNRGRPPAQMNSRDRKL